MIILAFDPGTSGALAVLTHNGDVELHDLPVTVDKVGERTKRRIDALALRRLLMQVCTIRYPGEPRIFVVEDVRFFAPERAGGSAMASLMETKGTIIGVLAGFDGQVHLVDPRVWQKLFGIRGDKAKSLVAARNLYPTAGPGLTRKMDNGRADALLIAHWASRNLT